MKATIELWLDLNPDIIELLAGPMMVESISSPPGGDILIGSGDNPDEPFLTMSTGDLSTSRAMLNSYLGLLTIAVDAATRE